MPWGRGIMAPFQCSAMAARLIARKSKFAFLDLAYTAALLHDIGKVILNNTMKETYRSGSKGNCR